MMNSSTLPNKKRRLATTTQDTAIGLQLTADRLQLTTYNLRLTTYGLQLTAYRLKLSLSAYRLRLTAYRLPLIASRLQLTAYNLRLIVPPLISLLLLEYRKAVGIPIQRAGAGMAVRVGQWITTQLFVVTGVVDH